MPVVALLHRNVNTVLQIKIDLRESKKSPNSFGLINGSLFHSRMSKALVTRCLMNRIQALQWGGLPAQETMRSFFF
jgi:hypothetical protein